MTSERQPPLVIRMLQSRAAAAVFLIAGLTSLVSGVVALAGGGATWENGWQPILFAGPPFLVATQNLQRHGWGRSKERAPSP